MVSPPYNPNMYQYPGRQSSTPSGGAAAYGAPAASFGAAGAGVAQPQRQQMQTPMYQQQTMQPGMAAGNPSYAPRSPAGAYPSASPSPTGRVTLQGAPSQATAQGFPAAISAAGTSSIGASVIGGSVGVSSVGTTASSRGVTSRALADDRVRSLYFNDPSRSLTLGSRSARANGANVIYPQEATAKARLGKDDLQKVLGFALQALLNVQALDKDVLASAMLSHHGSADNLDAMFLMQRLMEVGPALVKAEDRLRSSVKQLSADDIVKVLKDIGLDEEGVQETLAGVQDIQALQEDVFTVLKEGLPANTLDDAIQVVAQRRLKSHLERRGVTRYSNHIISLRHHSESWASVWERIYLEYPSRPISGPLAEVSEHRASTRVIVIGPGFGMLATPYMIGTVRDAGFNLLELPMLPNLEQISDPRQIQQAVNALAAEIERFQPHVIIAASKGGLYFPYFWQDPNWSIPCLLINAHPNITQLPKNAPIVVTQGSRDETFKRIIERQTILLDSHRVKDALAQNTKYCPIRYEGDSPALVIQRDLQVPCLQPDGNTQMHVIPRGAVLKHDAIILGENMADQSHLGFSTVMTMDDIENIKVPAAVSYRNGREDLETLARTAAPMKGLLYLSCSGITVRPGKPPSYTRLGDAHAGPESLCKNQCLPRLIDAAASGRPEDAIHESWALCASEERRAGETFLGGDPESVRRFWVQDPGGDLDVSPTPGRYRIDPRSEEFLAIQQVFYSNPEDKVYQFNHDWKGKRIINIDRVQQKGASEAADAYYQTVKDSIESCGTRFVGGVHTRWLFHGTNAVDSIVTDPVNGFKVTLAKTSMWGIGVYFARDAQYPDDHGFFGEPRADGSKDMLMCLVMTGMSTLGDESFAILPYRYGTTHRYNSFVDSLSDPEILVVNNPSAIIPAYVITYV